MRSLIVSIAAIVIMVLPQTGSACCLWPFFPTYSAGYYGYRAPGWGPAYYGGYSGYAPPAYGGYGGSCGSCGSCGNLAPAYSAGYGGCGISSVSGCCGTSSCGSYADPVSSGKPVPDPISDRDRDDRTYEPPRDDREPIDGFDRSDSLGSDRDSGADWDRSRDRDRSFGLDRDLDSDMPDFDRGRSGLDDLNDFNDTAPFRGSNRPEIDPGTQDIEPPTIDRSSNKPPMNSPIDEDRPAAPADAGAADSTPADSAQGAKGAAGASGAGTESPDEVPVDLLEPEDSAPSAAVERIRLTERESRSSHYDVRNLKRLALTSRARQASTTLVSSSRTKQQSLQWISVPLPEGRNRL